MAIEQQFIDLINADIDGEIDDSGRAELARILAGSPEAQLMHDELTSLCSELDSMESLEPPKHLRHGILEQVAARESKPVRKAPTSPPMWKQWLAIPLLHQAAAFAAGVMLTLALIDSKQISEQAFDDVTDLVGTISDTGSNRGMNQVIGLNGSQLVGTVSVHKANSLSILEFNLKAAGPVEIITNLPTRDLWFRGFAQLANDNASVIADTSGKVTMRMQGDNRYALYLQHAGEADSVITFQFYSMGDLIHEEKLILAGGNGN